VIYLCWYYEEEKDGVRWLRFLQSLGLFVSNIALSAVLDVIGFGKDSQIGCVNLSSYCANINAAVPARFPFGWEGARRESYPNMDLNDCAAYVHDFVIF